MTRVNAGIDPKELPGKLLLAEHREITRIPNAIKAGRAKLGNATNTFTLGKGHMTFFYARIGYLKKRYEALYKECKRRRYYVMPKHSAFNDIPSELMQDWQPTPKDRKIVVERIASKGFKLLTED